MTIENWNDTFYKELKVWEDKENQSQDKSDKRGKKCKK